MSAGAGFTSAMPHVMSAMPHVMSAMPNVMGVMPHVMGAMPHVMGAMLQVMSAKLQVTYYLSIGHLIKRSVIFVAHISFIYKYTGLRLDMEPLQA